jgi:Effector-associated domain 7
MAYDISVIFKLIQECLSDDELQNLCLSYFPRVHNQFTTGQTKDHKIRLLVDYVSHHQEIPKLLEQIQKLNPTCHSQYADNILNSDCEGLEPEVQPFDRNAYSNLPSTDPRYRYLPQQQSIRVDRFSEADILKELKQVSAIGRNWVRTIDNRSIERKEKSQIITSIDSGKKIVLVIDLPGGGKTCLLLDILEYYERSNTHHVLFIRGDSFSSSLGIDRLPTALVEKCECIANTVPVVVIIDSLDVLSASRQHQTLKEFLSLIDRLIVLEKVSVIVSCRSFDLDYDPHLSQRSWQHRVNIAPLDFDTVVSEFLRDWHIDPDRINDKLQQLLRLPQNLKLYGELAKKGVISEATSIYQLHEEFIEELIVKNPVLGTPAVQALESMADRLLEDRTWDLLKRKFDSSEEIFRSLISLGVLLEKENNKLSFSHQTLAECLMVKSNLGKGIDLTQFITDRVQLPFVRPAIRAFLFYLRVEDLQEFWRQVRSVLSSDRVAYHIKRLVCESIAEIEPEDKDWNSIMFISKDYSKLFGCFLERVVSYEWLIFLKQRWLPLAKSSSDRELLLRRFLWRLEVWKDRYPEEVIELWIEAINSQWFDRKGLTMVVCERLNGLQNYSIPKIEQLLQLIMKYISEDRNPFFIKYLSRWIEANNSGDNLLWQYITKTVPDDEVNYNVILNKLKHIFSGLDSRNFLEGRLSKSDRLLSLAVESLERWSTNTIPSYLREEKLWDIFISESSYRLKHSSGVLHDVNSLTCLLEGIEKAFQQHSQVNSKWWQANEPRLRNTRDACLRYFVIQAYKVNIETNLAGIIAQLADRQLFESPHLGDELAELTRAAYPYLETSFTIEHQAIIMSLHEDLLDPKEDIEKCINKVKYKFLKYIPIIYRTEETQDFINSQEKLYEYGLPPVSINLQGSITSPSFATQQLLSLSDRAAIELLNFYIDNPGNEYRDYGYYIGGRDEVRSVLREAASLDPVRFTSRILQSNEPKLYPAHIPTIVEGIGNHLRFRFGNSRSGTVWNPVEPLADGIALAQDLLKSIERYSLDRLGDDACRDALSGCCDLSIDDSNYVDRLSLQLFWLYQIRLHEDKQVISSSDSLLSTAINSTSGVVSEAAMRLYNRRLELNLDIPELLTCLIQHAAKDRRSYVRVGILHHLAFTIHKQPEWGWKVFADIFQEPQPSLWQYAEKCLYHNYQDRFDLVSTCLERIFQEGMDEAGETWGRISALASLSGHIELDHLLARLESMPDRESAWNGVAQVFTANLHIPEHKDNCYSGLLKILDMQQERLPHSILLRISKCFWSKMEMDGGRELKNIDSQILNELLHKILPLFELVRLDNFDIPQYLSELSQIDPLEALKLAELLGKKAKAEVDMGLSGDSRYLIMTLKAIFAFAETEANQGMELIDRAIALQDLFLELNIYGMDDFLDKAARN